MNYLRITVLFALCSTINFALGQSAAINLVSGNNSTDYPFDVYITTNIPLTATGNPTQNLGTCKSSAEIECYSLKTGTFTFVPTTVAPTTQNTAKLVVTGGDGGYSIIPTNISCHANKDDSDLYCTYTLPSANN